MKKVVREYIEKNKNKASKRITSQLEASKLVSRYLQLLEQDKIDLTKYRNLIYGAKVYSDIMKNYWQDELEKRLETLERNYEKNYRRKN